MLSNLLTSRDLVTGLPDREYVERYLKAEPRSDVAVLYIRIELLRELEHEIGRFATDEALSDFAERVKARIRAGDMFARLETNSFSIIVERMTDAGLRSLTNRVRSIRTVSTLTHREIRMHTVVWDELRKPTSDVRRG